jgi:hypothetical protein
MSPSTKKVFVAAVILIVVLITGVVIVKLFNSRVFSPEAQAATYLHALARGDAEGALQTGPSIADGTLTDAALRVQETKAPMTKISLGRTTVQGSRASVAVDYELGGQPVHTLLTLVREGSKGAVFDHWKLTDTTALVNISMPEGLPQATLNGVPIRQGSGSVALNVLPGALVIESTGSSGVAVYQILATSAGSDVIAQSPDAEAHVRLEQTLTSAGKAAALASVDKAFAACLTPQPVSACPISAESLAGDASNVLWTPPTPPSESDAQVSQNENGTVTVSANCAASVSWDFHVAFVGDTRRKSAEMRVTCNATVSFIGSEPSVKWS